MRGEVETQGDLAGRGFRGSQGERGGPGCSGGAIGGARGGSRGPGRGWRSFAEVGLRHREIWRDAGSRDPGGGRGGRGVQGEPWGADGAPGGPRRLGEPGGLGAWQRIWTPQLGWSEYP